MNNNKFNWLTDRITEIVDESDNRANLIEDITNFIDVVAHTRGGSNEIEVVDELSELMENSDEYGFTELKLAIKDICEKYSCEEEEETEEEEEKEEEIEEEEEEEEEEPTNYGYGYINDTTIDGKARVEIVKLLINNVPALMGNDNEVNEAITYHITAILNSLAD